MTYFLSRCYQMNSEKYVLLTYRLEEQTRGEAIITDPAKNMGPHKPTNPINGNVNKEPSALAVGESKQ